MSRAALAFAALAALALASSFVDAAGPRFWRIEGTADFLKGELTNLSLDSEARLRLGPEMRTLYDPELPNAWSVARDRKGVLYVGTGNDGRVFRVDGAAGEVIFDAEELEVYAVAVAPDGELFAATSPDGAVYAIDAAGDSRVVFDPDETYIWALAFDAEARLIVATGAEGRVHRVGADGTSEVILDSAETHVLSLAVDNEGRVFAGSAPGGIVYRIGPAGDVFVLVDSPFREIKGLVVDPDGGVFAAAVNGGGESAPPDAPAADPGGPSSAAGMAQVTVTETFTVVAPAATVTMLAGPGGSAATAAVPRGAVLHIDAGGSVETLWSSNEDIPHAVARAGHGVLVGTGDKAKLYRVDRDGSWALLGMLSAQQVTGIVTDGDGAPALVTSNPARVFALTGKTAAEGHFISEVQDAEAVASWGRLRWEGTAPAGTTVGVETRSGNSSNPDTTWSPWSPLKAPSAAIGSESARFLQIRLTLTDGDGATQDVEAVSAAYLQRNLRPRVTSITLHPPGQVFQKPLSISGEPEILGLDADPVEKSRSDRGTMIPAPSLTAFGRQLSQRGLRTFGWTAEDPNGDLLVYDVEYRAVGDDQWRPLRREIAEPVLAWDTSAVPDGRYLVRITASDAPDNPPALALDAHKDSASFEVDNAPPTLTASLVEGSPPKIRAVAHDAGTPIRRLEVSVDAGRWQEVYPTDGINDSKEEVYEFPVPSTGRSGPRLVVLRVSDRLGNVATGRVDVP